jgi:hypothetical protein
MMRNELIKPVYLKNKDIDKTKWDGCISNAGNGVVYAYSFYLDTMSKHWDALILNDYHVVMPLTWNRKYGFDYLYQPFFTASLGVFGNNLSAGLIKSFLENIPEKFKYWDIYLNHGNLFTIQGFKLYERSNYILRLNNSLEKIVASFSQNHTRNIKKAVQAGFYLKKNIDAKKVIELAKLQSSKFSPVTDKDYQKFYTLYKYQHTRNKEVTYGVFNPAGELMSSCVFFFSHNRVYFILAGNHPAGRSSGSSHFLINGLIKEYAGQNLILDFEGSDVKNIAQFYRGFGATEEKYAALKLNRLPAVIKLFKK